MQAINWRKILLWDTSIIDVDYWLQYAEGSNGTSLFLSEWFPSPDTPLARAVREWDSNQQDNFPDDIEYVVSNTMKIKARNFAEQFIGQYGKINGEIILAFISQEA